MGFPGFGARSDAVLRVGVLAAAFVLAAASSPGAADRFRSKGTKDCLDCHDDTKAQLSLGDAHDPFRKRNCEACHKPHGILGALNLRAEGEKLCLLCHEDSEAAGETGGAAAARTQGSVVASDAFFPFADGLLAAIAAGATAVIQPGGSVRDDEVIAAADKAGLAMVFTGVRHFRH